LISVTITNRQKTLSLDRKRMRGAVQAILRDAEITNAQIGIAVVDDAAIAKLHGEFLNDPEPTDVLSFMLERSPDGLEGEVVVSADTAQNCAHVYGCAAEDELILYVIHGALHLVGYDDATPRNRAVMRKKEREYSEKGKPTELTTEARRTRRTKGGNHR
jgi:probable rRNA maturation factor